MSQNNGTPVKVKSAADYLADMTTAYKAGEYGAVKSMIAFGRAANRYVRIGKDAGKSQNECSKAITEHLDATLAVQVDKSYLSRAMASYALCVLLGDEGEKLLTSSPWSAVMLALTLVRQDEAKEPSGEFFGKETEIPYIWSGDHAGKVATEWFDLASNRKLPGDRNEQRAAFGKLVKEHGGKVKSATGPRTPIQRVETGLKTALKAAMVKDDEEASKANRKEGLRSAAKSKVVTEEDVRQMIHGLAMAKDYQGLKRIRKLVGALLARMEAKAADEEVTADAA